MRVSVYDVWSDGSFREGKLGPIAGAGWVVEFNGTHKEGSYRFPKLSKDAKIRGSDIAELYAVALALSPGNIPSGSVIRLRLDDQIVIDALKTGKMKNKAGISHLETAFSDAIQAINSMDRVEFIKASDRNNANMKRANDLARTATSPVYSKNNL